MEEQIKSQGVVEMENDFENHLKVMSCYNVINLDYKDRCMFVNSVPDCHNYKNLVDYIKFMECYMTTQSRIGEIVAVVVLLITTAVLILIIAIVADTFFGPALKVISKTMHMNEHLAGVTILAFGNSSASFFANINDMKNPALMYADLIASSAFVTMMSGGLICFLRPFEMNAAATIRDVLFFIAGILLLEYTTMSSGCVNRVESASYIILYIIYIAVNVVDAFLITKKISKLEKKLGDAKTVNMSASEFEDLDKKLNNMRQHGKVEYIQRSSSGAPSTSFSNLQRKSDSQHKLVDAKITKYMLNDPANSRNKDFFSDFFKSLKPITAKEWRASSKCKKIFLLIKMPIRLFTQIYIPLVDVEVPKHGWSKLLNCIQILISPTLGLIISMHVSFLFYTLPVTLPCAIFCCAHSRTDVPPRYHFLFSLLACVNSMFIIFICATEIDTMLEVVGTILMLSEDFSGATLASWGGGIADLVANVIMALHGYESMGFAASYGGPFFTTLISSGIIYSYKAWSSATGETEVKHGSYGLSSFLFLLLALSSTLIWSSVFNFSARRSAGVFNIFLYILYLTFAILFEKEVIHNFSADQHFDVQ